MEERTWNNQELSDYISLFPDVQRESVLKEILESKLLQDFLATTEGRLILGNVVDMIRDHTMQVVRASIDGFDKHVDEIRNSALQINIAYNFMYKIASMATKGEEHEKVIRKRKAK
jgi:hypothetical protein